MELLAICAVIGLIAYIAGITSEQSKYDDAPKKQPPHTPIDYSTPGDFYGESEDLAKLNQFRAMKKDYMASATWSTKRTQALVRDSYCCVICGEAEGLEAHHISGYGLIPNEGIEHIKILCRKHHQFEHDTYGYPNSYNAYILWEAPLASEK